MCVTFEVVEDVMTSTESVRARWTDLQQWIVAACLVAGGAVRLVVLGRSLLSFDEAFTANVARQPVGDIPSILRATDSHPPLDYLLRNLFVGSADTAWLRLPSALIGVATLLVVLWWMWNRGWFGVFVIGFSSFAAIEVLYARQARMYAIVILAGTI